MPGTTVEDVDSISNHQPASIAAIDELLIRYLDLLDQYQKEQDKINRSFSSVSISDTSALHLANLWVEHRAFCVLHAPI